MDNILTLKDVETAAKEKLSSNEFQFIAGGTIYGETLKENVAALKKYKIRPRVLRDVSNRDLSIKILGHRAATPIGISATSQHEHSNPDGDFAIAKTSSDYAIPMTVALMSTVSLKDVMESYPTAFCFQQIIISNPKTLTEKMVAKAEEAQAKGLVVTVDMPIAPIKFTQKGYKTKLQFSVKKCNRLVIYMPADRYFSTDNTKIYDQQTDRWIIKGITRWWGQIHIK